MLYVICMDFDQFRHYCRSRGWSGNDRGITGLWEEKHMLGVFFRPGDLVIELERSYKEETDGQYNVLREFSRRKSRAPSSVGFRYEPSLGYVNKGVVK